jgi:hypothetical protein
LGIEKGRLIDDYLNEGRYHLIWNAENIENNYYFIHFLAGSTKKTVKIIFNR